jgi:hypothetical protein
MSSINYLSPVEFNLTIKRLPNTEFTIQRATIPSINLQAVNQPTPFNMIYQQADKLNYSEFRLTFIINEDMKNYIEVFDWMHGISSPQKYSQFKNLKESEDGLNSDITLLVLNSKKRPNILFTFYNCFPMSLSEINLDTTQTDIVYPEASVDFRYDYFKIEYYSN